MTAQVILQIVAFGLRYGPTAVEAISTMLNKDEITMEDWEREVEKWNKGPSDYLREARERRR